MSARQARTDSSVSWLVAVCGFFLHIIMGGHRRSIGLIFGEITEAFGYSKKEASAVLSAYFIVSLASAPLATLLVRLCAARIIISAGVLLTTGSLFVAAFTRSLPLLVFLLGVVLGLGCAFIHAPALVLIGQHFERRRSLAIGVCLAGGAVGAFCFPPLLGFSMARYGFPGAMMTMAGASLQGLIFAVLMWSPEWSDAEPQENEIRFLEAAKEAKSQESEVRFLEVTKEVKSQDSEVRFLEVTKEAKSQDIDENGRLEQIPAALGDPAKGEKENGAGYPTSLKALLRCPAFYAFAVSGGLATELLPFSFFLIPAMARDLTIPLESQTLILLLMGIPDLLMRLAFGFIADSLTRWRCDLFLSLLVMQTAAWLAVTVYPSFAMLMTFSQVMGLMGGAIFTLYVPLLIDSVGLHNLTTILSSSLLLEGGVSLALPPILAVIREVSGSWSGAYHVMAALAATAALLVLPFCRIVRLLCRK